VATLSFDRTARVMTVDAPSVVISIQEIYDQCKTYEELSANMDDLILCSAGGKETLGAGNAVAITLSLLNGWKIAFEARGGPLTAACAIRGGNLVRIDPVSGTWDSSGMSGTILSDSTATFLSDGILPGDTVTNNTDGGTALVVSVDSDTQITHDELLGDDWHFGDSYTITASNPIEPTAFTHIQYAQSTSPLDISTATNEFVEALAASTYDGTSFEDIMRDLLAMANARIVESPTGTFTFYDRDNVTARYVLVKAGSERTRS
jgi:hypothetical protein